MTETTKRFTANNADIGEMCALIAAHLARRGYAPREVERLRLTMETLLRRIGERRGWGTRCELALGARRCGGLIRVRYLGEAFDPTLIGREEAGNLWSAQLLAELGLVPVWSFRRGVNTLELRLRSPERTAVLSLAAAALGAALALGLPALGGAWAEAARQLVFAPLLDAFFAMAGFVAALKVFFGLSHAICGVGDTLLLGRMGRLVTGRFLVLSAVWSLAGVFAAAAAYRLRLLGVGDAAAFWGFVPRDPLSPFLRGHPGQLICLGTAFGGAMLLSGGRVARVREWAEQCDGMLSDAAAGVCRLSPVAVLAAFACADGRTLVRVWEAPAVFLMPTLLAVLSWLLSACVRLHISPSALLHRTLPPARAAFRSATFSGAFGAAMDNCENELHIAHPLVLTGLSIGSVLFVPVTALAFPSAALLLAAEDGGALSVTALLSAAAVGAVFSALLPRRPGALLLALALAYPAIAADNAALVVAADLFAAVFGAALTQLALQWELLLQAERLDEKNAK